MYIMAFKTLSELDDYQLTHSEQDCRGWDVVNASGTQIGTVREMLVDTESERVTALELDSGAQIPVNDISLRDGRVVAANSGIAGAGGTTAMGIGAASNSVPGGELVLPVVRK
jgi:sporulation protein YlmC with PRC-barrel domain